VYGATVDPINVDPIMRPKSALTRSVFLSNDAWRRRMKERDEQMNQMTIQTEDVDQMNQMNRMLNEHLDQPQLYWDWDFAKNMLTNEELVELERFKNMQMMNAKDSGLCDSERIRLGESMNGKGVSAGGRKGENEKGENHNASLRSSKPSGESEVIAKMISGKNPAKMHSAKMNSGKIRSAQIKSAQSDSAQSDSANIEQLDDKFGKFAITGKASSQPQAKLDVSDQVRNSRYLK
jgi:hypothetical protein